MPRQAADGRHGLELVDHVARDEVDVVVAEADAGVVDALTTQLVQFGIVHPLHTLWGEENTVPTRSLLTFPDFSRLKFPDIPVDFSDHI